MRGIKDNSAWGFPRGKLSKGESDSACAARETLEETGLDIGPRIDEGAFIEVHLGQQRSRLYIVAGVRRIGWVGGGEERGPRVGSLPSQPTLTHNAHAHLSPTLQCP